MLKHKTNKHLDILITRYNQETQKMPLLQEMDFVLDKYLAKNSHDITMWLRRALVLYTVPLADNNKALECLEYILQCEPSNISALLILAYIQDHTTYIDSVLLNRLLIAKFSNNREKSMLQYAQAWYFYDKDTTIYEKLLIASSNSCDNYTLNHIDLGNFYIKQNNESIGKLFLAKGLRNIKMILDESSFHNPTSIINFINEYIKGVYCSKVHFDYLCSSISKF